MPPGSLPLNAIFTAVGAAGTSATEGRGVRDGVGAGFGASVGATEAAVGAVVGAVVGDGRSTPGGATAVEDAAEQAVTRNAVRSATGASGASDARRAMRPPFGRARVA